MGRSTVHYGLVCAVPALAAVFALVGITGCDEDSIEKSIGSQTAAAVETEYRVDNDPLLNEWINNMGQTLVAHSTRQQIPYSFRVIDTDMVNAFAAPYGYIYFLRGMLDFADTEDEIWFICGHEITHIVKRDSIKSLKKNILYSVGASILGNKSDSLGQVAGLGAGLLLLHYSRDDERDADDGGCNLCYAAGYDPNGAIGFFEKLAAKYERGRPSQLEHLLLTHPETPTRIARQRARPPLDLNNAEALVHIGRGYQRRFQYWSAADLFQQTVKVKPGLTEAQVGLADCYAATGLLQRARQSYQAALDANAGNAYALRRMAALPEAPLPSPTVSQADRSLASSLLNQVGRLSPAAASMNAKAEQLSATVISQMSGAVQMSKDSTSTMLGISDTNPDFSDDQRGLFMTANGAVGSANNAVYAVESLDARFRAAGADCRRLSSRLVSALQFCAAGNGYDADVEIINRSRIELGGAIEEFGKAADSWPQAVAAVNDAQRAAADTMTYMQLMAKQPDNEDYPRLVKQATDRTKQLAKVADGAVGKAKNATRRAEARALLARINLAVLGQRPEMRQVADGMVAHYTLSRPEQVAKLRELGFGHGDAAFALAASKVTGADATSYISTPPASSLISSLQTEGVRMDGATVLLRYLANALEHEMELAEKAG